MKVNESKLPVEDAAEPSDDDATYAVAEGWVDEFTQDRAPDEILLARALSARAFMSARGLASEQSRSWAWVLQPGLDLPVGWSTAGADPEGAAIAEARFAEELEPTVIVIPDAATMLALPVILEDDAGHEQASAVIATEIVGNRHLDHNTLVGAVYGTGLATMQLRHAMKARTSDRALKLAQAAAQCQRRLVEPTDLGTALRVVIEQLRECDHLAWADAGVVNDGARHVVAGFGDQESPEYSGDPGFDHAKIASARSAGHAEYPVTAEGVTEACLQVQSKYPLTELERETLASIAATVAGTIVRHRADQTIESLRRSATRQLVEAQERERSMVAADIHDGVLQQLGATAIRLELAQSRVEQGETAAASSIITDGTKSIRECARELRALLMELRPQVLDDNGLNAALSELGRHIDGVEIEIEADVPDDLGNEFSITVFRIVQEALTNIQKHAQAEHATVKVTLRDDAIAIDITDDGVGYEGAVTGPSSEGSHLGLLGMRERANMFGGTFSITGASGRGTEIHATLPLDGVHRRVD